MTKLQAGKPTVAVVQNNHSGIAWAPLDKATRVSFMGTSFPAVRAALVKTFGEFPIRILPGDETVIRGMAAAAGEGGTPYAEILEALRKHGDLELRLE